MHTFRFIVLLVGLVASVGLALPASGQPSSSSFVLQAERVGAGGGSASGSSTQDDAAIGQAAAGSSESASFRQWSGFIPAAHSQAPNVFTVDVTTDDADANPGDGTCATSGGDCTLRAAIEETNALANAAAGPDTIKFDISGTASPSSPHVIAPAGSELPTVLDPVVIDGTSEPDYNSGNVSNPKPVVEINGTNAVSDPVGLRLSSDGNTVRGLAVINFEQNGIYTGFKTTKQTIIGCHLGIRADGTTPAGNGGDGISVRDGDRVGGTGPDDGNIIGDNGLGGVNLLGSDTTVVRGNYIGTNPSGKDLGNAVAGVRVEGRGNMIGGTGPGEANVIAYNGKGDGNGGVTVDGTANAIRGNEIYANTGFADLGLGIDLEAVTGGRTGNDAATAGSEDDDDGANHFQNFPVITSTRYDGSANEITITYEVPSQPGLSASGASTYPLAVDFYRADTSTSDAEAEAYLGTDTYTASDFNGGPTKTVTFTPDASVTTSDKLVATATDANGNTSEFSAASSQLPVELASFEAARTGRKSVELTWTTASETGNAGFRVQHRASDDEAWTTLGFVESKADGGTTTDAQSYRFSAEDLLVGTHRFRLEQVDLDGTATVHDPVAVELEMKEPLRLAAPAPNPVSGQATLSFAVKESQTATLRLYDALGQEVATVYEGTPTAGESQAVQFEATDLASGMYFLRLRAGSHVRTQRLTVVR